MKKMYSRPLVYCENRKKGIVVSNSETYKQKMKIKLAELQEAGLIDSVYDALQDGSRK